VKQAIGDETVSILLIEKGRLRIDLSTNFGWALQAKAVDRVQAEIDKDRWGNVVVVSKELLPSSSSLIDAYR
jgi:iron complex transport system substrate-binding protein